jgi:hypothetical protein
MPSNIELKKALEEVKKELVKKNKKIEELTSISVNIALELEKFKKERENDEQEDSKLEIPEITVAPPSYEETVTLAKKKKRSIWNLYLW